MLRQLASSRSSVPRVLLPRGVRVTDLEDFDFDEFNDEELEELEDSVISAAAVAATADELETELFELAELVKLADRVRTSGVDSTWVALRGLLRESEFRDSDSPRKLIVFSEHKDTLDYVAQRVRDELGRHEGVVTIPWRRATRGSQERCRTGSALMTRSVCSLPPTPPAKASTCRSPHRHEPPSAIAAGDECCAPSTSALFACLDPRTRCRRLGVDLDNPTGALGVYERMGYEVVLRQTQYSRPV